MKRTIISGLIFAGLTITSTTQAQISNGPSGNDSRSGSLGQTLNQAASNINRDVTAIITGFLLADNSIITRVANGNDSGPGSLRQALIEGASNISINSDVSTIQISETLDYDFTNTVQITGLGTNQIIDGSDLSGNSDILSINQGATFSITNLNFIGSFDEVNDNPNDPSVGTGIFVNVPNSRNGTVEVILDDVSITNVGGHGVHVSDCTVRDECSDGQGSPASVLVDVKNLLINRVGIGRQDGDGIRVDERGNGNITFVAKDARFTNVGADGVELDEGDNGNITANVDNSVFDSNGEFCAFAEDIDDTPCDNDGEPDLDDGFDIDETGSGSILVTITNSEFTNNFDEGLDFDEEDNGQILISVTNSLFLNNEDQGIRASESGSGDVEATFTSITVAENNQDDEAIRIEEENDGNVVIEIFESTVIDSDDEGLRIEEGGSGSGTLAIRDSNFTEFDLENIDQI